MSWQVDRNEIITTLITEGYKEIAYRLEQNETPMSLNHREFVLKAESNPITDLTSNSGLASTVARLEITYKNVTNDERAANFDLWLAIVNELRALPPFQGFVQAPLFEDSNDDRSIGKAIFYYNVNVCLPI